MRDYKLTAEMKQVLKPILEETIRKDESRVSPLVYCAMAPLEDLCIPPQEADTDVMQWVEDGVHSVKVRQDETSYLLFLDLLHDCMTAGGAFVIPVVEENGQRIWGALGRAANEVWLPVFTSMEKAQYWLADDQFQLIPMEDAIMRAAALQPVTGMVFNPLADDILVYVDALQHLSGEFLLANCV